MVSATINGARGGTRTPGARLRTAALYPLSYAGTRGAHLPKYTGLAAERDGEVVVRLLNMDQPSVANFHDRVFWNHRTGCAMLQDALGE